MELVLEFPSAFPSVPPLVRIFQPRLQYLTGGVTFGGTFTSWMLTHEGWSSGGRNTRIFDLMLQLRNQLIDDEAVIDPRNFASARDRSAPLAYSIDEAVASAHRTVGPLQSSLPTIAGFEVRFAAHSTEYFTQISGKTFPKALEYGNRIVLPRLAMEVLMRNEPNFQFPCYLELTAPNHTRTFVSPLEFSAPDDRVLVLPSWLHRDLRHTRITQIHFS